jgi:beta-galactosidase
MNRSILSLIVLFIATCPAGAKQAYETEFSTAGFFQIQDGGREVFNFNVGWRFYKGAVDNAEQPEFDDSEWIVVNIPHGLEYLPEEASGCVNYQGEAWYRKHFRVPENYEGQRVFLHFEAIMGKSRIWINGSLAAEHYGGYLPVIIDATDYLKLDKENIIAVLADNSDDPTYPPGKSQDTLDFTYFGGIYRDVWLYSTNPIHITDSNLSGTVAGGGVFVHYENLSSRRVDVVVATEVRNETGRTQQIIVSSSLLDADDNNVGSANESISISEGSSKTVILTIRAQNPHLWHPDDPYLYNLISKVVQSNKTIDGLRTRIGIRKIEFRGAEGFFLNNEHFDDKLIGANRHQDFAYIGNALPNSLHWRDAHKLRNAGMRIIRSAHYPQDPAFMDACDQLGLFVIVATPGWQFWNDDPIFEKLVYDDIRNMVRRDRNHASVILWEPILNETGYPDNFAENVHKIAHEEYPFQGAFTVCDGWTKGSVHFDVKYGFRPNDEADDAYFVREWGDNVDGWSAQNSNSRTRRSWGEAVQLVQVLHFLGFPNQGFLYYDLFYSFPDQIVGGTLWHSFDHNRGYHPDPFYGGIMDIFRQPKYSYYGFKSMRDPGLNVPNIENGPMVYIANEMSPFSDGDVLLFTNTDEVRLTFRDHEPQTIKVEDIGAHMRHPPLIFKDVYDWSDLTLQSRSGSEGKQFGLVAEGLIEGKVVATHTVMPARRESRILLNVDSDGLPLTANGSDIVTVIATMVDEYGNVKRLSEERIMFEVDGEGNMVAENKPWANPRKIEWGTAPILVQSTTNAGKITVRARTLYEGINTALPASITIESIESPYPLLYSEIGSDYVAHSSEKSNSLSTDIEALNTRIRETESELQEFRLQEVQKQQDTFDTRDR